MCFDTLPALKDRKLTTGLPMKQQADQSFPVLPSITDSEESMDLYMGSGVSWVT